MSLVGFMASLMAMEEHFLRADTVHSPSVQRETPSTRPSCNCTLCPRRSRIHRACRYLCSWWTRRAHWSLHTLLLSWPARGTRRRSGGWGLWCRCFWTPFSRCDSCAHSGPASRRTKWWWSENASLHPEPGTPLPCQNCPDGRPWVTAMEFSKYTLRAPAAGFAKSP